jgi:hypothetical protein
MTRVGTTITAAAATAAFILGVSAKVWSQEQPAPPQPAQAQTPDVPPAAQRPPGNARKSNETKSNETKSGETHTPFRRIAFSGNEMIMSAFNTLASDCHASVRPDVRVVTPPANGTLRYDAIIAAIERPPGDFREKCNGQRTISVGIFYKSKPGYVGADSATIDVDFRQGFVGRFSYDIEVR